MTGTPMENRLTELWSIYRLYQPWLPGEQRGVRPQIRRDREEGGRGGYQPGPEADPALPPEEGQERPGHRTGPAGEQEQKEYIPLTVEQSSLYEGVLQDLFEKLENGGHGPPRADSVYPEQVETGL